MRINALKKSAVEILKQTKRFFRKSLTYYSYPKEKLRVETTEMNFVDLKLRREDTHSLRTGLIKTEDSPVPQAKR